MSAAGPGLRIEFCRAGGEEELADFDRRMGNTASRADFWRWKYFENPAGGACVAVARMGGEIVGRVCFLPVRVRIDERPVLACQQVDVAILATHRGGGIYFQLAHAVMEEGESRGIAFGFGFATEETRALSTELLGFTLVGPIRRLVKVLDYGHYARSFVGGPAARVLGRVVGRRRRKATSLSLPTPEGITPVPRFDERFDRLAADLSPGRIMVVRDSAYLDWRYADCPTVAYGRYAAQEGGAIRGFVVFHTYEGDGAVRGVIDDLVCPLDDGDLAERLLSQAVSALSAAGAVNVICWLPAWNPLAPRLRKVGFRAREARNFLIFLSNKTTQIEEQYLGDERNWYYTHGDSDYHVPSGS